MPIGREIPATPFTGGTWAYLTVTPRDIKQRGDNGGVGLGVVPTVALEATLMLHYIYASVIYAYFFQLDKTVNGCPM